MPETMLAARLHRPRSSTEAEDVRIDRLHEVRVESRRIRAPKSRAPMIPGGIANGTGWNAFSKNQTLSSCLLTVRQTGCGVHLFYLLGIDHRSVT
jgi:hypothetical protein